RVAQRVLFRRQAVVDDDRNLRLQTLGPVDAVRLDGQLPVQLRLDGTQRLVAATQHQYRVAVGMLPGGDVFALGPDLRDQLRQSRLDIETRYQLHAMITRLGCLGRPAVLRLLETDVSQHRFAIANDGFDGAVDRKSTRLNS